MSKVNYQTELDNLIKVLDGRRPKLMLHSCCGPCSSYVLDYLKNYFEITVFYYNPNIFPDTEYEHRLSEQKRLIKEMGDDIKIIDIPYIHAEFLEAAKGLETEREGGARCEQCFRLRLSKTLEMAEKEGCEYFGTTLTVSPHKNAELINSIGAQLAGSLGVLGDSTRKIHGNDAENVAGGAPESVKAVKWLPSDFKKKEGYKLSIELSKKYNLYRQDYCGCEFAHVAEYNASARDH